MALATSAPALVQSSVVGIPCRPVSRLRVEAALY